MENIESLVDEVSALEKMTEAEAMAFYKTDSKSEARQYIIDWWYSQSDFESYESFVEYFKNSIKEKEYANSEKEALKKKVENLKSELEAIKKEVKLSVESEIFHLKAEKHFLIGKLGEMYTAMRQNIKAS
ncbi:MAG: DUF5320 domain-containing protein [Dysgonamonadaceae bacterium]|jgi:predicted RNase H-like nuclease (RuvC/YqgF family)|nr:DUF5320 domain-containing protein [Dysgonamonadaceae bacterium]